jgi:hypothetical protein
MMIPVPGWVAVILVVLGAVVWIGEQVGKARRLRKRRETQRQLARDLAAPKGSTRLPYTSGTTEDDPRRS